MGSFFDIDGPFARFGNAVADVLILSMLWIFFSIPIFTIGASTTALFYVTTRRISNKEGYLTKDFWKSFKSNFRVATVVWLFILCMALVLSLNIINIDIMGSAKTIMLPLQICIALELTMVSIYVFPLIARFEMKFKDVFKTAFFMANKHLPTTISCIAVGVTALIISYATVIFSLIAISIYAFITSFFFMRIFKKYRPEIDAEEDIVH